MSEQSDNIEAIKKGYEAFARGDIEAVMSLFDDDVEWVQPGDSAISGTYHGKAELGGFFMRLAEKAAVATPRRFFADGDTVVVLADVRLGDENAQDADVFTLRNGKTVRAQVHTDTALMTRVYGKKQLVTG